MRKPRWRGSPAAHARDANAAQEFESIAARWRVAAATISITKSKTHSADASGRRIAQLHHLALRRLCCRAAGFPRPAAALKSETRSTTLAAALKSGEPGGQRTRSSASSRVRLTLAPAWPICASPSAPSCYRILGCSCTAAKDDGLNIPRLSRMLTAFAILSVLGVVLDSAGGAPEQKGRHPRSRGAILFRRGAGWT
jgi:hypothetical protein